MAIELPEAFEELFTPSRYKAFYGGRGSAKSHSFATALLSRGSRKTLRVLCAREIQLSIKDSVKQLLDDKIAALDYGKYYTSLQNEIRGVNGTDFLFAGLGKMTADQIKSMEGVDIVWVEEAQTISKSSLEILIPTIRKPNSELWFSWNPRHVSDPVDQRFRGEVAPENAIIKHVNWDDNPWFPDELKAEMAFDKANNPERYGHIWLGEYEPTAFGAIWDRATIHQHRVQAAPDLGRVCVAVDPAVSTVTPEMGSTAGTHGIVVVGEGLHDQRGYVLEDASCQGDPLHWAQQTVAVFDRHEADFVVVEINQGGDMVKNTLHSVRPGLPIHEVRATRGKHVRAEPIAALYRLGRVSHVGTFNALEDQMVQMTAAGYEGPDESPDRVDALVWAMTELFPALTTPKSVEVHVPNLGESGWMA